MSSLANKLSCVYDAIYIVFENKNLYAINQIFQMHDNMRYLTNEIYGKPFYYLLCNIHI